MHSGTPVHWTQEYEQEDGLQEDQLMHCYVERYKNNSNFNELNKFAEFNMKK